MERNHCTRRYAARDMDGSKKQNMEPNHCAGRYVAHDNDYNKGLERSDTGSDQSTCLGECTGNLNVGFLYEIDHKQLPFKYPIQLRVIRVVMLAEISELTASVRFPSTHSLATYFASLESREVPGKRYPDLDEQYVMGLETAKEVLVRQILPPEFQEQGCLQSFWLLPPKFTDDSTSEINQNSIGESLALGEGDSSLNCEGLLNWGVRRRITFKLKTPQVPSASNLIKEEGDASVTIKIKDGAAKGVNLKRKRASLRQKKMSKAVKLTCDQEKKPITKIRKQKLKLSYDRWSQERYKTAEVKMLEIMKEKEAVIGKPILRAALRLEARKHIGDTGLLDHLLKHMAGKVAPNGEDRFRRRHNADGAMEYWLESVDLVNIRKEAGVTDPYWAPPPGWKPGDSLSQDPNCWRELTLLKEKMTIMERDMKELTLLKEKMTIMERDTNELLLWKGEQSNVDKAMVPFVKPSGDQNTVVSTHEGSESTMMIDYTSLVKKKAELEGQLVHISKSLKMMEEETNQKAPEGPKSNEEENKEEKQERQRSGFRVCKPQGTFLWPNMGGSCSGVNGLVQDGTAAIAAPESLIMVPAPPWVTSTTILLPPSPLPTPSHSTSPVKPLPVKRLTSTNPNASLHFLNDNFCGTPTSCSTCRRTSTPLVTPSTTVTGGEARSTQPTQRTYHRKVAMQHQHQNQSDAESVQTICGRSWLALATPNTPM